MATVDYPQPAYTKNQKRFIEMLNKQIAEAESEEQKQYLQTILDKGIADPTYADMMLEATDQQQREAEEEGFDDDPQGWKQTRDAFAKEVSEDIDNTVFRLTREGRLSRQQALQIAEEVAEIAAFREDSYNPMGWIVRQLEDLSKTYAPVVEVYKRARAKRITYVTSRQEVKEYQGDVTVWEQAVRQLRVDTTKDVKATIEKLLSQGTITNDEAQKIAATYNHIVGKYSVVNKSHVIGLVEMLCEAYPVVADALPLVKARAAGKKVDIPLASAFKPQPPTNTQQESKIVLDEGAEGILTSLAEKDCSPKALQIMRREMANNPKSSFATHQEYTDYLRYLLEDAYEEVGEALIGSTSGQRKSVIGRRPPAPATYTKNQEFVIGQLMATSSQMETEKERAGCQVVIERVKKDSPYADEFAEYIHKTERAKQGDTQAQRELDDQHAKANYQQQVLRALDYVDQMFKQTKTDEEHEQVLELTKRLQDPTFLNQFLDEMDKAQKAAKEQKPATAQPPQPKKKHWWQ